MSGARRANMPAVSNKSLSDKLFIKPGKVVILIDAPAQYEQLIRKQSPAAAISTKLSPNADIIQIFVDSAEQLKQTLPTCKQYLKDGGAVWVSYCKGSSKKKSDINRDTIAAYALSIGLEGVAIISIDDDWSALRLKVVS